MSFKEMAKADLSGLYSALGDPVVYSRTGDTIFLLPEEGFDIEFAEYKKFRAIITTVEGIEEGDTFTEGSVVFEVVNFKPSDDGLEMYIGVK